MPTPATASLDPPAPAALGLDPCAPAATYPGSPEHVRQVRAHARGLLAGCPAADEVILCLSELAANAVLHSDSRRPGGTFTVRIESCPGTYVRIEVEGDFLRITGERRTTAEHQERNYYRLERRYGRFARQLRLPSTVAREGIRAEFDAGILIITLPKRD